MSSATYLLPRLVLAASILACPACGRGPAVPDLRAFGPLDPAVSALVQEHLTAIAAAPDDANRWGVLAMTLEANGLTPQAQATYATASTLPASHGRWWFHLARLRGRDGDTAGAIAAYDRAIAISPDYVPARWRRGLVLLDVGDLDGAEAAFTVATNLAATDSAAATGLARVHLTRGRHAEAIALLEALIARAPADRYAYHVLAAAYRAAGRGREADEAVAAGVSGEPQWVDPWSDDVGAYRRGFAATLKDATALGMAGRHAEALPLLEKLRGERPDDRELLTFLGGTYAVAGRTSDAVALLDKVLAAHPDDFDAIMNLATARMLERDYEAAAALAERALALRARDPDATRLRGVVAWRAGRLDDAERWLADAAALNPGDAKALAWIGDIRRSRGKHDAALAAYRDALARDPLLPDALVGAAWMAVAAGATDDAARWLARARRLAPGHTGLAEVERQLAAKARR